MPDSLARGKLGWYCRGGLVAFGGAYVPSCAVGRMVPYSVLRNENNRGAL